MQYTEYSHRHGKELLNVLHPNILIEIETILNELEPFSHGKQKNNTAKNYLNPIFLNYNWNQEKKVNFNTDKEDFVDFFKDNVGIEMEFSRFEMFFRDFFRFMLLYKKKHMDVGIIITYDEMAYQRWIGEAKSYKAARASLMKLIDFLEGDYSSIVNVPMWCIGIE